MNTRKISAQGEGKGGVVNILLLPSVGSKLFFFPHFYSNIHRLNTYGGHNVLAPGSTETGKLLLSFWVDD